MLQWLFGDSKQEKQAKKQQQQNKLQADQKWVYDYLRQYLTSPVWKNPLLDLVEENCHLFQDAEENKFQYTKIHQQFTGLAALLLETMIEQTGITEKQLQKCIIKGMKGSRDARIFQQILLCDNFMSFKKMMISKNKQLELEALKKMQVQKKNVHENEIKIDTKELQRMELEKAIAMSMAMDIKAQTNEEKQLQEAIRQSKFEYETTQIKKKEQEKKAAEKKEEPPKKPLLGDLPPLVMGSSKMNKPVADIRVEEEKLKGEIEALKKTEEERKIKDQKQQESNEDRKKRLQQQRQMIRKKKQEERQVELKTYAQSKQETKEGTTSQVSQQELQRRRNLMKKLKEQLKD